MFPTDNKRTQCWRFNLERLRIKYFYINGTWQFINACNWRRWVSKEEGFFLQNKESPDWEVWAENVANVSAPLLAERCASGELCALLARLCRRRPRAAPLPALAPPVRRVLTRNVDFARAPNARQLVRDYIRYITTKSSIFSHPPFNSRKLLNCDYLTVF